MDWLEEPLKSQSATSLPSFSPCSTELRTWKPSQITTPAIDAAWAAQPLERDPRADEGVPFLHESPTGRRTAAEVMRFRFKFSAPTARRRARPDRGRPAS